VIGSLAYSLKSIRGNPLAVIHALLYGATVTYLRVLRLLARLPLPALREMISQGYHGKVVKLADARQIITVNRDIALTNLEQVLPYRRARDLILVNPSNISVYQCPCRSLQPTPCLPTEVCLIVGEPFADLVRLVQPFRSRRISAEEALAILEAEDRRGHVHTAWFKSTMLDRFYAICNCCSCCCLGMRFMAQHGMKLLQPSGYRADGGEGCVGCGTCVPACQFGALELVSNGAGVKRCRVTRERCYGCGVCERRCTRHALKLVRDPARGVPLDIEALAGRDS
jgi:ferredoxin